MDQEQGNLSLRNGQNIFHEHLRILKEIDLEWTTGETKAIGNHTSVQYSNAQKVLQNLITQITELITSDCRNIKTNEYHVKKSNVKNVKQETTLQFELEKLKKIGSLRKGIELK